jgi:UTP--glucose-1-phosphate uridylyltransferase
MLALGRVECQATATHPTVGRVGPGWLTGGVHPPKVRKAVIPAAGLGTRFLPATKAQPKEMLPLVDTPAIQYVLQEAVDAGCDDILIVTGRNKRAIEDHFDRNVELELELEQRGKTEELNEIRRLAELADVHYVRQGEPLGLGHAVSVARKHVGDEPFCVLLGDDLMDGPSLLSGMIEAHGRLGRSVIALMEVPPEQISSYGCADAGLSADGNIVRIHGLVEKPAPHEAPSNLAIMGRYVFTPEIFESLERVTPGKGGEIQLTDAIVLLLERQEVFGFTFTEGRFDTGNKLDYLKAIVELGLRREDLGEPFGRWLVEHLRRRGMVS